MKPPANYTNAFYNTLQIEISKMKLVRKLYNLFELRKEQECFWLHL